MSQIKNFDLKYDKNNWIMNIIIKWKKIHAKIFSIKQFPKLMIENTTFLFKKDTIFLKIIIINIFMSFKSKMQKYYDN